MSKADIYDEPPPYSPSASVDPGLASSISPSATGSSSQQALDPTFFGQTLRTHLSTLPARIQATSARNQTAQNAADLATISILVPHVERFLSTAAQKASSPSWARPALLGTLYLIPSRAVPPKAELGDLRERRREGEFVRIVRVEPQGVFFGEKAGPPATGDKKARPSGAVGDGYRTAGADEASGSLRQWDPSRDEYFDSWGRFGEEAESPWRRLASTGDAGDGFDDYDDGDDDACSEEERESRRLMWWNDERAAKRLASYLSPAPASARSLERLNVQKTVASSAAAKKEASGKKSWLGFGKKGGAKDKKPVEQVNPVDEVPGTKEDRVDLTVKAQELSFQQENEFGVFESVGGWGIVVAVKIRV